MVEPRWLDVLIAQTEGNYFAVVCAVVSLVAQASFLCQLITLTRTPQARCLVFDFSGGCSF